MLGVHQPQITTRARVLIAARWLAAFVILALLLILLPYHTLSDAIRRLSFTRFVVILVAYLATQLLAVFKWRMVVNAADARLDFRTSLQCYAGGLFGMLFIPSIIGGDVVRLAVGLRRSPNPSGVLAGNFADRFLDMLAQATLLGMGLLLLPGSLRPVLNPRARHALILLALAAVLLVVLFLLFLRPLLSGRSFRFRRRIARLRSSLRAAGRRPGVLVSGWLLGISIQGAFLLMMALLAIKCGLYVPLRIWLYAWPLAKLAALIPITQGGIGIREAALVALLSPFGAPPPLVLATGLVWEAIVIVGALVGGLVVLLLRRRPTASLIS